MLNFVTLKIAWDSGGDGIMRSKRFGVTLVAFLLLSALDHCFLPLRASCQVPPAEGLIVPGGSVAGVKLGSSLADFSAVFPKHPKMDENYNYSECGGRSEYHWLDLDWRANGVYAYLRDDKIYHLRVQTPRFSLANGIRLDAAEKTIRRMYPRGQAYVLRHSGNKAVGGRDLRYWVDSGSGVAFELYWDELSRRRRVRSIDIFPARTDYQPEGCVGSPQDWVYGELIPENKGSDRSEQRHFSAEVDGVDKPVALPQDVLAILTKHGGVRDVLEHENAPTERVPQSWFSASAIHLNDSKYADLVVMAIGPLRGANVTTFWVFRATPHGYELVLAAPAHDLGIMKARSNGYREIELTSMTAVQISSVLCRFDGKRYAAYKTRSQPIR